MKILCVSDQLDPLVYSTTAKQRFSDVDAVLCAGDLPSDYIDFIVSTLNKPTFFVFGNHNLTEFSYYHRRQAAHKGAHPMFEKEIANYDLSHNHGAVYTGFKAVKEPALCIPTITGRKTPLLIAGASGSRRYNNGLCQYTDRQMFFRLLALAVFFAKYKPQVVEGLLILLPGNPVCVLGVGLVTRNLRHTYAILFASANLVKCFRAGRTKEFCMV